VTTLETIYEEQVFIPSEERENRDCATAWLEQAFSACLSIQWDWVQPH